MVMTHRVQPHRIVDADLGQRRGGALGVVAHHAALRLAERARLARQVDRMMARHRAQLEELLTNYGRIDLLSLDQWLGPRVWPQLRQTIFRIRELQPDVMIRARGIGNYGDYYTPEGFVPGSKSATAMPWMVKGSAAT